MQNPPPDLLKVKQEKVIYGLHLYGLILYFHAFNISHTKAMSRQPMKSFLCIINDSTSRKLDVGMGKTFI